MAMRPGDQALAAALITLLQAAARWEVLRLRPGEKIARLVNWRFENNEVAGDPGIVVIEKPTPAAPGPVIFEGCSFVRCTELLADRVIELINGELGQ